MFLSLSLSLFLSLALFVLKNTWGNKLNQTNQNKRVERAQKNNGHRYRFEPREVEAPGDGHC